VVFVDGKATGFIRDIQRNPAVNVDGGEILLFDIERKGQAECIKAPAAGDL